MVKTGKKVKNFSRPATGDKTIELKDLAGKNIVIYFYAKDNTPGCTTEGQNFRDAKAKFTRQNTIILGVSRDSIKKHENFKTKQNFNFDLLSDEDESLCRQFDVIKLKKLYGREYMGIDRSTFLIDTDGVLIREWRGVKVKDHVDEILLACKKIA
ncbi:MAG: peroxiredoxin [Gammaproteobacteria bacterium]|nr:peroxiredoxin [Gammaproteobacteria bacterium]